MPRPFAESGAQPGRPASGEWPRGDTYAIEDLLERWRHRELEFAPTLLDHTQNPRFVQVILGFEAEDRALPQPGVHADQDERAEEWLGGG